MARIRSYAITMTLASVFFLSHCGRPSTGSQQKIAHGVIIDESPKSAERVDGVLLFYPKGESEGSGCTSTAVSSTTVVTAAHCVFKLEDPIGKNGKLIDKTYCVNNGFYKNICTDQVFINPKVSEQNKYEGIDTAYAVFPDQTFQHYFPLSEKSVAVGDEVVFVGYSKMKLDDLSRGSKRFGYNKVSYLDYSPHKNIYTQYDGTFEGVLVNGGDSGGPLLKNCALAGETWGSLFGSEANVPDSGGMVGSIHTNLLSTDTANWLKSTDGAYFCGLTGEDSKHCPKEFAYQVKAGVTKKSKEFPCTIGQQANRL